MREREDERPVEVKRLTGVVDLAQEMDGASLGAVEMNRHESDAKAGRHGEVRDHRRHEYSRGEPTRTDQR